jgi:hypothetical protein
MSERNGKGWYSKTGFHACWTGGPALEIRYEDFTPPCVAVKVERRCEVDDPSDEPGERVFITVPVEAIDEFVVGWLQRRAGMVPRKEDTSG